MVLGEAASRRSCTRCRNLKCLYDSDSSRCSFLLSASSDYVCLHGALGFRIAMFISSVLDHELEGKLLGGPAISLSFARLHGWCLICLCGSQRVAGSGGQCGPSLAMGIALRSSSPFMLWLSKHRRYAQNPAKPALNGPSPQRDSGTNVSLHTTFCLSRARIRRHADGTSVRALFCGQVAEVR